MKSTSRAQTEEGPTVPLSTREDVGQAGRPAPEIDAAALLGEHAEVLIRHGDETYRLRRTRQGKLILTK